MESWEHYVLDFDYGCFKSIDLLKRYGCHWFQSLRDVLLKNNVLYVIEKSLRFPPGPGSTAQDCGDYQEENDHCVLVRDMKLLAVGPHL